MNFDQICKDESLYGHALLTLPHKIYAFSKAEFCLNDRPDPGTLVVYKDYLFARAISFGRGSTYTYRTEIIIEKPLFDLIEFLGRRVLGSCATAVSFLVLPPIAFSVKLLHLGVRRIKIYTNSTELAKKIKKIWNNTTLFGNALTSAPSKCCRFAVAPLSWHLRADGTDRRTYRVECRPSGNTILKSEYRLVPFEILEFVCRRIVGGTVTLTAAVISPIGLVAKSLDLASQSIFHH